MSIWISWWRSLGPPGPPGGGPLGPPGDAGPQGPARQSFIWQSGLALNQSIADMNRSVVQLLTAHQTANAQLQLQTQQNQTVQIAHMDALRFLAESTQQRNFDPIFVSIPTYDRTNKEGFFQMGGKVRSSLLAEWKRHPH